MNALPQIAAAVTPAVMVSACGLMLAAMAVLVIASIYLARRTIQAEAAEVLGRKGRARRREPARAGVGPSA